jgi:hypothetical protein
MPEPAVGENPKHDTEEQEKDCRRLDQKKHNAGCEVIRPLDYRIWFHRKQNNR